MKELSTAGKQSLKKSRVVEIVGAAGAGKTTLFKTLRNYPEQVRLLTIPNTGKLAYAPFFFLYGLRLIPDLVQLHQPTSRQISSRELAWMSILIGWPHVLKKKTKIDPRPIILDQGPVYLLAELKKSGPEFLRSDPAEKFWHKIYNRWSTILDMIILLDADDEVLVERIQGRKKGHIVKNESESVVLDFLANFRSTYENVVSRLVSFTNGPRLVKFDTGQLQAGEIAERLLVELRSG